MLISLRMTSQGVWLYRGFVSISNENTQINISKQLTAKISHITSAVVPPIWLQNSKKASRYALYRVLRMISMFISSKSCSLMQSTKNGAKGVSTNTALYSSAGVAATWMASICSKDPSGWHLGISSEIGLWCKVPVIKRMMLSIM